MQIIGFGTALPDRQITDREAAIACGFDPILTDLFEPATLRRSDPEQAMPLLDLAVSATSAAMDSADLQGSDLDAMILTTHTPDTLRPASVRELASALNLNRVRLFQLTSSALGPLQALAIARRLDGRTLIVCADVNSRMLSATSELGDVASVMESICYSDGAGSMILDSGESHAGLEIVSLDHRYDPRCRNAASSIRWGGVDRHTRRTIDPVTDDEPNVADLTLELLNEILREARFDISDVAFFLLPERGGHLQEQIVSRAGIALDRVISCWRQISWVGSAALVFQLSAVAPRLHRGDHALGIVYDDALGGPGAVILRQN